MTGRARRLRLLRLHRHRSGPRVVRPVVDPDAAEQHAVVHPQAGSFGTYAERYLSPWFGFVVRATYGFIQILAIGAEVTAVAIYFARQLSA